MAGRKTRWKLRDTGAVLCSAWLGVAGIVIGCKTKTGKKTLATCDGLIAVERLNLLNLDVLADESLCHPMLPNVADG